MAKLTEDQIPGGLRRVHRQLERWRSTHHGRSPLPEALWRAAGEAAREHGVFRTGQVLHLEYGKLKRVMESTAARSALRTSARSTPHPGEPLQKEIGRFFHLRRQVAQSGTATMCAA